MIYEGRKPSSRRSDSRARNSDGGERVNKPGFHVGKIPDDQGFYSLPTVPDSADVSDNRQKSVPESSDIEFGGKWKVCQKLKFVHKCMIGRLEPNNTEGCTG